MHKRSSLLSNSDKVMPEPYHDNGWSQLHPALNSTTHKGSVILMDDVVVHTVDFKTLIGNRMVSVGTDLDSNLAYECKLEPTTNCKS